ncbi:AraC family transcriptional regulator [Paenibacillus yanchengensis]|uniref:AraC family transcriptional regulator n=1 Tax=Paenibacillus yanchengensis TaxID=2035833 RepID=A0ABW4YR58_9BACL
MDSLYYENNEATLTLSQRQTSSHHMPVSHFHGTYEIYYMLRGKRQFFIRDRMMTIGEGDLVIIAPNVLHRTTNADPSEHERFIINIHEQLFVIDEQYKEVFRPLWEEDYIVLSDSLQYRQAIKSIVSALIQEMKEQESGFVLYCQSLAMQLLLTCCRYYEQHMLEVPAVTNAMHERMMEVVKYINEHYMEKITLAILAEKFYVSSYYLSRSFKEATGFTFVEYVNSVRIKEAVQLLENTSVKVQWIANRVGFGSITHFGRVFKEVTGHAPLYFRKSIGNK